MTIICTKIELPATHDDIEIEQQQGVNITGIERPNNSFLKRAYKYSFSKEIHSVEKIAKEADETLFLKTKCRQHCLNPTLPPLEPDTHGLRPRGHSYDLPECRLQLRENSCIIRCLYRHV